MITLMHYSLIKAKTKQLEFAEEQLLGAQYRYDKIYWKHVIYTLKSDLSGPPQNERIIEPQSDLLSILESIGWTNIECRVFGLVLLNDSIIAADFVKFVGDRGKIYRTLDTLIQKNLVVRVPDNVSRFFILAPDSPLMGIIDDSIKIHIKYKSANKKIVKLINEKKNH